MKALARLCALAATVAAVTTAHAGGPLSICNGNPVKFPGAGTVNLSYDQGPLGPRTKAQADAIVTAAVANFTNVTTATVTLGRAADLPVDVSTANVNTYYNVFNDGINPVIYDTDGSIIDQLLGANQKSNVLGFAGSAFIGAPTCAYAEGRAVINGFLGITDTQMRTVLAHEIGHLIGLDHTQLDSEQGLAAANFPLMYPQLNRSTDTLHEDDVAAVTALYPAANVNASYGTITGNLRQANGVTAVRGANVWAREIGTNKLYSVVSDYLLQNNGFFRLLLPPGSYHLFAGAIRSNFTGGSSVGPYSETAGDVSFQPPLYVGGVRMAPIALGGGTPTMFTIVAGCAATATFALNGTGSIGGNCGTVGPEVFPPNGMMPPGYTTPAGITNGGFEQGTTNWPTTGNWVLGNSGSHEGALHMVLAWPGGMPANNLQGTFYQTVTIPAGVTSATLGYWLAVSTQETEAVAYDLMRFEIYTNAGALVAAGDPHSNLDAGGYRQVAFDLAAYAGQTIRVGFSGFTDETLPTVFRVDDVSLAVTGVSGWSVASDQANEGTFSLKSGPTANGAMSDLTATANFGAGTVSFARRVSSEAGQDFLRFYIDGVMQGEWSGEVPWSVVSFPITAGSHTLRWSYQKSAANNAGGDAAWIDSVVFPTVAPTFSVTVSKSGTGSGTVSSQPAGIDCGSTCTASFTPGFIFLNAVPAPGSVFSAWSGGCSGNGATCSLSVGADTGATAIFTAVPPSMLTVSTSGNGTVTSVPAGINCPGDCTESYPGGTVVRLTATPAAGSILDTFNGCNNVSPCDVTMNANQTVGAMFVPGGTLDVTVTGPGSVTSLPAGINCPGDCTQEYPSFFTVSLTPVTPAGSVFLGWSGACTGTGLCSVSTSASPTTVGAFFGASSNVALAANGGVATASSTLSGALPVAAVNDGNRTGKPYGAGGTWADANQGVFPDFVQIAFAGNRVINRVVLVTTQDDFMNAVEPPDSQTFTLYGINGFSVERWNGSTWINVATVTGNNLVKRTVNLAPVETDRIRVVITGSVDGYSRVAEIEAYGATPPPPTSYGLTVMRTGDAIAYGRVTSSPAGIDCGVTCTASFPVAGMVTLTATAPAGTAFVGWTGEGCSGTGTCQVTMSQARNVSAAFAMNAGEDSDSDGIPNPVEVLEGREPFSKDNDVFQSARLFAMQQYRDFLGREGEASGIQFYVGLLNNGTADRIAIIESFLTSPEFQNGLPSVTRLYFSFFNRIPDYGGLTFQLEAFRAGTPLDVIAQNFVNSPEFTNTYGALTNDQYINLVYQNVLNRAPDPDGYTFYMTRLNNGQLTKGQMMIGFSESQEFQNLTSNESFVIGVYVGLLKRTPEASGLDFYVDLLDGGTARRDIIPGFFNSPEYRARFLP